MSQTPSQTDPRLDPLFSALFRERFIHQRSKETYDNLFTLWHLDPHLEPLLSRILSKWVVGDFCLRYLAHVHDRVRREASITEPVTAGDLSDTGKIKKISRQAASQRQYAEILEKEILPALKGLMDHTETETLTDLTRLAHAGDYLLAGLEDLRKNADPSYPLWMESLPHYYERDLRRMGLVRAGLRVRRIPLTEWVTNLDQHLPCCETMEDSGVLAARPVRKERRRGRLGINRWPSRIQ